MAGMCFINGLIEKQLKFLKYKFNFNKFQKFKTKKKVKNFLFFLKKKIKKKKKILWNSAFFKKKPEIPLFTPKNGLSAFYPIPHSTKSKNIPWNSARGIRFLPPSILSYLLIFFYFKEEH
jgi:hypothetical protein